ncbi:hypothetical protein [Umezawaea sp. Da 62-37]|nr:hypothetical protein [Umezawaea sp. Da 62-37]WNV86691.1 hypothetical protein RM788_52705 [Umezawaea sp. Da 62-37]WNV86726.1 hypothetical protein RM788_00100 [Umezawaea sp. Da 62-37]
MDVAAKRFHEVGVFGVTVQQGRGGADLRRANPDLVSYADWLGLVC